MAGSLGLGDREAEIREQTAVAALANVALGLIVRPYRRGADDVDPELQGETFQLHGGHVEDCAA